MKDGIIWARFGVKVIVYIGPRRGPNASKMEISF